jgi:hypothetical protein
MTHSMSSVLSTIIELCAYNTLQQILKTNIIYIKVILVIMDIMTLGGVFIYYDECGEAMMTLLRLSVLFMITDLKF